MRITGLRLRGPQREVHPWGEHHDWIGIRNGFRNTSGNQNLEVDNCELFQWPQSAIYVAHEGTACVRNNYIHHNQRWKSGYGVGLQGSAKVSIEENLFAFNRHCVAGTGYPTQEYTARHNVVLASNNPPFDMHGLIEGGSGGWDYMNAGTPYSSCLNPGSPNVPGLPCEVGGNIIRIDHNTVTSVSNNHRPMDYAQPQRGSLDGGLGNGISSVYLRGIPLGEARVDSNNFADSCGYRSPRCSPGALRQVFVRGGGGYRPTPVNFFENDNRFNRGWSQSNSSRRFFERFGDVFQEKGETTIPANGHFALEDWPYQWSAHSRSRLSHHTMGYYGLEDNSRLRTWKVENGKATTRRHDILNPIGEMRSKRFQINKDYVSFRIVGYMDKQSDGTCDDPNPKYANQVAMLRAHDDAVIFKENVPCKESFVLYDHDLSSHNSDDNNNDTWAYFVLSDGDWNRGGWIEVDDIYFFDGAPAIQPTNLTAEPGYEQVTLQWTDPDPEDDPSIRGWAYSMKAGAGDWSDWETIPGGRSILEHTVRDLDHGILYSFKVSAVNIADEGPPSEIAKVALINVAYDAESYGVMEGGDPVEITVRLTPAADRKVKIPILAVPPDPDPGVVDFAEADDYSLSSSMVSFVDGEDTQQFTITAVLDDNDTAKETLILGFGNLSSLPAGVGVSDPAGTTITIYEKLSPPSTGLSATAELNAIEVSWDEVSASATPKVTGYKLQYRRAVVGTQDWSDYLPATTTGPGTLSYTHRKYGTVSVGYRFQYQVKAISDIGESDWSDRFPAQGSHPPTRTHRGPRFAGCGRPECDGAVGVSQLWVVRSVGRRVGGTADVAGSAKEWQRRVDGLGGGAL